MKFYALVILFLGAAPSRADDLCAAYVQKLALGVYTHNSEGIQGSDPKTEIKGESKGKVTHYKVTLSDGNDEGQTWTVFYDVRVITDRCRVKGLVENVN